MKNKAHLDTKFHGFPNKSNNLCAEFYKSKGMIMKGNHVVLECDLADMSSVGYNLLEIDDYNEFVSLHDDIFPSTYYSGKDIISMLDEDNAVIVKKVDNNLVGYAFVNIDSSLDGNIEFIGVKSENRREGHGITLMNMVLSWFKEKGSGKLILCVDSKNDKAISLYKKKGFTTKNSLEFFSS